LYLANRLSAKYGCKIYLKREDLNHTGSHKINKFLSASINTTLKYDDDVKNVKNADSYTIEIYENGDLDFSLDVPIINVSMRP
ncbi:hypothetical protein, partial [Dysgonomonas sp. 511]|uniref:hypothetical protein n=1 Tax=Dysgonomonas sp. 511 TaxID=2302930 RepID=UPI0013D7AC1E